MSIDIDLRLSMSEVRSAFDYEKFDEEVRMSAGQQFICVHC